MSRRHAAEKREILPDAKYGDRVLISIMWVAPWLRAQVLGSLVKPSGTVQLRTTTSLSLRKA